MAILFIGFFCLLAIVLLLIGINSNLSFFYFLSMLAFSFPFIYYKAIIPYWEYQLEKNTIGCYITQSDYYNRELQLKKDSTYYLREANSNVQGKWKVVHLEDYSFLQLDNAEDFFYIAQKSKQNISLYHSENEDLAFNSCPCKK